MPVENPWLEVLEAGELRRFPLAPGRTRIGGLGCEVVLASSPAGEVHIWDTPPRALYTGGGAPPELDGIPREELALADGLVLTFGGARITYRLPNPAAGVLEELVDEPAISAPVASPAEAAPARSPGHQAAGGRVETRLMAGLLADQDLAPAPVLKKWREAVKQRRFDPDTCARELLAGGQVAPDDPRLLERSGRLMRDLLMAPLLRGSQGASRKVRQATRSGLALVLSQAVAVAAYTLLLGLIFLLLRARWGWSPDGLLDGVLETLGQFVPDPAE
ncbi:MAG: hypothetical protein CMJ87_07565 [Planctomycetes bacterium]|nr:hypothetical protein [Planctomycetota bacterium]